MKIESVEITGFGTLINRSFTLPADGITILTGKNEAGKTTFLEFTRRMLFGFPTGKNASKEYDPISGLVKGGKISVILSNGKRIRIIRTKTQNRAFVQHILLDDATSRPVEELYTHIGRVSREFYSRVFALSHRELSLGGTLAQDQSVKQYLIGGLLSLKKHNPHTIIEQSARKAQELFVPRGSRPTINALISEHQKISGAIRRIEQQADEYLEKRKEYEIRNEARKRLEEEESSCRRHLSRLQNLAAVREHWITLTQKESALSHMHLPDGFTLDHDTRIEEIHRSLHRLTEEIEELKEEEKNLLIQAGLITLNEHILSHETDIIRIQRLSQQYMSDISALSTLRNKKEGKERDLKRALEDLGPGWDEERIRSLSLTSETKNNLFTAKVSRETHERELQHVTREIQSVQEEIARMNGEIPVVDPNKIAARTTASKVEEKITHLSEHDQEINRLTREISDLRHMASEIIRSLNEQGITLSDSFLEAFDYQNISDTLRDFEDQFGNKRNELQIAYDRLEQARYYYNRSLREEEEMKRQLSSLGTVYPVQKLIQRQKQYRELQDLISQRDGCIRNQMHYRHRISGWMIPLLAGSGLICIPAGILSGQVIVSGLGILILLIAGAIIQNNRRAVSSFHHDEIELSTRINTLASALSLPDPDLETVAKKILRIDQLIETSRKAESLELIRSGIRQRIEEYKADLHHNENTHAYADQVLLNLQNQWAAWVSATFSGRIPGNGLAPRDLYPVIDHIREVKNLTSEEYVRKEKIRRISEQREKDFADCIRLLDPLMSACDVKENPAGAEDLARIMQEINQTIHNELQKESEKTKTLQKIQERERLLHARQEQHKILSEQVHEEETEFKALLSEAGFSPDCNPARLESLLQEVMAARMIQRDLEEITREIAHTEGQIRSYQSRVRALVDLVPEATQESSIEFLSERLDSLLQEEKEKKQRSDSLRESISLKQQRIKEKEDTVSEMRKDELLLYDTLFVADYEQYSQYRDIMRERENSTHEISQIRNLIDQILGDPGEHTKVSGIFRTRSKEDIEADIEDYTSRITAIRDQIKETDTLIGSLRTEIVSLESSQEHNRLLTERNMIESSIRQYAEEWAIHTIAAELLRSSVQKFEREKQPAVVARAAGYFCQMTNGAYTDIILPIDGDEFSVIMNTSITKHPGILSAGTADQLYVALRLAYVTEYCSQNEPLPLVLDDILVNCDAERRDQAISTIGSVAKTAQVIYCTCHDETIDRFTDMLGNVHVIDMDAGESMSTRAVSGEEIPVKGDGFSVF